MAVCNHAMNIAHQVVCILVYDQKCLTGDEEADDDHVNNESCGENLVNVTVDWFDTLLNYALVIANAGLALAFMKSIKAHFFLPADQQHGVCAIPSYFASCLCFLFVVAFQILLCLALKCTGVSIIWCSALGWLIMLMRSYNNATILSPPAMMGQSATEESIAIHRTFSHVKVVVGVDTIALLYYAVAMEVITTVAHVCAIILGSLLWSIATGLRPASS